MQDGSVQEGSMQEESAGAESARPLRRVRLVGQEVRAVRRALQATLGTCALQQGQCTDVYLDRNGGEFAARARREGAGAVRVVVRDMPGAGSSLALELERDGHLASRQVLLPAAQRRLVLGPAVTAELFPFLPRGVAPTLAVRCQRQVLHHPEGWWVRLDEELQAWHTSGEALLAAAPPSPAAARTLPGALLELHGTGPAVPAWLEQLLERGLRWPDVFVLASTSLLSRPAPGHRNPAEPPAPGLSSGPWPTPV